MALALSSAGYSVLLIDQEPDCLLRTSLRNEGKIHLGFTYANDRSLRTARLMLESSLRFGPLLDRWLPAPIDWERFRSRPFTYLIMRDSLVSLHDLHTHYSMLETEFRQVADSSTHYLGITPSWLWREVEAPHFVSRQVVQGAVETAEVSIDLAGFSNDMRTAIGSTESIHTLYGRRIETVTRGLHGFVIEGLTAETEPWEAKADVVVNCLWDGRLAIDAALGFPLPESWVYRLKYRVLAALPAQLTDLPALTMALGPYGDIVPMADSSYLSWYPVCRKGWSSEVTAPAEWQAACRGIVTTEFADTLAADVFGALDRVVPGIKASRATAVDAGIVMSLGSTDIDDPHSRLHERSDIGVRSEDGYFSIDTGKFGCAPLFAAQLVDQL